MQSIDKKLTAKEKLWIKEYFKAGCNATAATREAYGGTPTQEQRDYAINLA